MAFDTELAGRIRKYLFNFPQLKVEEKKMFRGLSFMVNGKMCVNVSGDNLMCRFDPELHEKVSEKKGFEKMVMRGKEYKGYCYVDPIGLKSKKDLENWVDLCLDYNERAKASKKKK
jgi:TfoX/Sxy family transcriptional regulator of competence genes